MYSFFYLTEGGTRGGTAEVLKHRSSSTGLVVYVRLPSLYLYQLVLYLYQVIRYTWYVILVYQDMPGTALPKYLGTCNIPDTLETVSEGC